MRYIQAAVVTVLLTSAAVAQETKPLGEPVYDDRGKVFGYVEPNNDDLTELECVPEDPRPYPECSTLPEGADDDGDDGEDS